MLLSGLQKLTLLDYPGKVACTVFTGGCNLRCPFCHNASLVKGVAPVIPEAEVFAYLEKRRNILDGVCVTGGEPLAQGDIRDFLRRIRELGFSVKLDTNGCFPDMLGEILSQGLADYVAMDIKNCPEKYPVTVGVDDFDVTSVKRSASLIMESGIDYEFRTTLVNELHKIEDMRKIGEWLKGAKRFFLQGFVNSGDLIRAQGLSAVSQKETENMQKVLKWYIPDVFVR